MFMCMCLDGTTKEPVSKITEENTAANEIGNWTRTSMEFHGKHFWQKINICYIIYVRI